MTDALGRLKRRPEFLRVAGSRRRWTTPGFILQALRREAGDTAAASGRAASEQAVPGEAVRLGLTASRKVGNAVARNRARRRLREAARIVLPARAAPGYDLVLVARQGILTRPFARLVEDLETALTRVGAARAKPDA